MANRAVTTIAMAAVCGLNISSDLVTITPGSTCRVFLPRFLPFTDLFTQSVTAIAYLVHQCL
jgi:hypothetical protein